MLEGEMFASRSALILTTAVAIALTSFDLRPAAAAPQGRAIAQQNGGPVDFSAVRKRHVYRGAPVAAFGALVGSIAGLAAAQQRQEAYQHYYYGGGPYYDGPAYYAPPYAGYAHPGWGGYPHHGWQGYGQGGSNGVANGANPSPGN